MHLKLKEARLLINTKLLLNLSKKNPKSRADSNPKQLPIPVII
jgi:hypothetical protein